MNFDFKKSLISDTEYYSFIRQKLMSFWSKKKSVDNALIMYSVYYMYCHKIMSKEKTIK